MKLFFRIAFLALLLSATLADDFGFDLSDALDDVQKPTPKPPPKKDDDMGFDLSDAFGGDDDPYPAKPPVVNPPPSGGGGGGTIKDNDLLDIGGGGNYEPDGGKYQPDGGSYGGRGMDTDYNSGADQPQDGEFDWGRILKMLNANMPEDFFMWMSDVKQRLAPLLERVLDLLYALPGEEQQEL